MGQEYHDLYFLYALITSDYVEYSTHCSQSKYLKLRIAIKCTRKNLEKFSFTKSDISETEQ